MGDGATRERVAGVARVKEWGPPSLLLRSTCVDVSVPNPAAATAGPKTPHVRRSSPRCRVVAAVLLGPVGDRPHHLLGGVVLRKAAVAAELVAMMAAKIQAHARRGACVSAAAGVARARGLGRPLYLGRATLVRHNDGGCGNLSKSLPHLTVRRGAVATCCRREVAIPEQHHRQEQPRIGVAGLGVDETTNSNVERRATPMVQLQQRGAGAQHARPSRHQSMQKGAQDMARCASAQAQPPNRRAQAPESDVQSGAPAEGVGRRRRP